MRIQKQKQKKQSKKDKEVAFLLYMLDFELAARLAVYLILEMEPCYYGHFVHRN